MTGNEDVELRLGEVSEIRPPDKLLIPEAVHGPDTRLEIDTTSLQVPPYNAVHLLYLVWPDQSRAIGTAWAVSPRTLVTAGHNLLDPPSGMTSGVRVYHRGQGAWLAPLKAMTVSGWRTSDGTDHRFDYGGLLMAPEAALPPPYLGLRAVGADSLGLSVRVAGFPYDKPFGTMWEAYGPVEAIDELLRYDVDTEKGQSGSPVLAVVDSGFVAVGIHVDADPGAALNVGVRLDPEKIAAVERWKAEGDG